MAVDYAVVPEAGLPTLSYCRCPSHKVWVRQAEAGDGDVMDALSVTNIKAADDMYILSHL